MRYCPYLGKETEEEFNNEHIIPDALGGANSFTIEVSESMNQKANVLIDVPFLNETSIAKPKTDCEIKSRSGGTSSYSVEGQYADGTGVTVTEHSDGEQVIMPDEPVVESKEVKPDGALHKTVKVVIGDSDPRKRDLMAKISKTESEDEVISKVESEIPGTIAAHFDIDQTALLRGFAKIAFGATIFNFPEWAKTSIANEYRSIFSDSWDPTKWNVKWQWLDHTDEKYILIPKVDECSHAVVLYGTPSGLLLCAVSLFGGVEVAPGDKKTALFEIHSPPQNYLGDAERWVALCDARDGNVTFLNDRLERPTSKVRGCYRLNMLRKRGI